MILKSRRYKGILVKYSEETVSLMHNLRNFLLMSTHVVLKKNILNCFFVFVCYWKNVFSCDLSINEQNVRVNSLAKAWPFWWLERAELPRCQTWENSEEFTESLNRGNKEFLWLEERSGLEYRPHFFNLGSINMFSIKSKTISKCGYLSFPRSKRKAPS